MMTGRRRPAFYEAVEHGDSTAVSQMLDQGFDVNQADDENEGTTPIMYASLGGQLEARGVYLLKRWWPTWNGTDVHGTTALMCAAQGGHRRAHRNSSALHDAADYPGLPLDPNVTNEDGDAALHFAAQAGHAQAVDACCSRLAPDPGSGEQCIIRRPRWRQTRRITRITARALREGPPEAC